MELKTVRQKYLDFFATAPRKHKLIPSAPLVLENDPTTLFTSSGMQPLVPYLLGEQHPMGKRLVNSQPSIRTQDIDEVGDNRHITFFEMLGNWSLGDYFKDVQIPWLWAFLTEVLMLPQEKLYVSIFAGNKEVARDNESFEIWQKLGMSESHIFAYGDAKNWWSRAGTPVSMPEGEIGGPDSEVFYEFTQVEHDKKFGETCHPNCDCGRFLEIGNSVFIEYIKKNGKLEELHQKNVDFGGGLERLTAAVNNEPDIFKLPVYAALVQKLEVWSGRKYGEDAQARAAMRIIADHMRVAEALAREGLEPGNKLQGYIMRRLIRRAVVKMHALRAGVALSDFEYISKTPVIITEVEKFLKTLGRGLSEFRKLTNLDGKAAFDLYQTYGFPLEITLELAQEKGQKVDAGEFKKAFAQHQEKSRIQSAGKFKGGLADASEETTKLHSVTHLIHAALREVLGEHISQKGSNITVGRLRFDFSHNSPLTLGEIQEVESLVNDQIAKGLPVSMQVMSLNQAKTSGALAFFGERYSEQVKVYTIGEDSNWFSREVCGGPHVQNLSQIAGRVKIKKQKSIGAGVQRIYAEILS